MSSLRKWIFFTFKDSNLAICRLSFIFDTVFIFLPSIFLAFLPCIFFVFLCVPKQENVAILGLDQLTNRVAPTLEWWGLEDMEQQKQKQWDQHCIGHWTHVAPSGGGENQLQLIPSRESNSDSRLESRYDTVSVSVVESKVHFASKILQHLRLHHTWIISN